MKIETTAQPTRNRFTMAALENPVTTKGIMNGQIIRAHRGDLTPNVAARMSVSAHELTLPPSASPMSATAHIAAASVIGASGVTKTRQGCPAEVGLEQKG